MQQASVQPQRDPPRFHSLQVCESYAGGLYHLRAKKHAGVSVLFGLVASLSGAALARAQSDYWTQPTGGSWENAANWSLGVTPAPSGDADFNVATGSPYTVSLGANENTANINAQNTSVNIAASSGDSLTVFESLNINASTGGTCSLELVGTPNGGNVFNISNGTLHAFHSGAGGTGATFLTVDNAEFINSGFAFNFGGGSTAVFNNSTLMSGMAISGTATVNASSGGFNLISVFGVAATLNIVNGSQITTSVYDVTIGNSSANTPIDLSGVGIINVSGAGSQLTTNHLFIGSSVYTYYVAGTGTLNVTSSGRASAAEIIVGSPTGTGTMNISGSGSVVASSDTIAIAKGSNMQVSSGGEANAATLNMSSGSTLAIGLDEGGISISGLATLAGSLDVTQGGAADPTLGETFDLLSFGSETGTFSQISLPPLDPGLGWSTANLYTNGSISVIAVPEPAGMGLLAPAAFVALARRRQKRGAGGS